MKKLILAIALAATATTTLAADVDTAKMTPEFVTQNTMANVASHDILVPLMVLMAVFAVLSSASTAVPVPMPR